MDALKMDFADASFDTVCIANSLHHMEDAPAVLSEMLRVLKPGGRMVVNEMYCDGQTDTQLTHVLLHRWWAAVDSALGITHRETYTRQALVDLLSGLGLADFSVEDANDLSGDPREPALLLQLEASLTVTRRAPPDCPTRLNCRGGARICAPACERSVSTGRHRCC